MFFSGVKPLDPRAKWLCEGPLPQFGHLGMIGGGGWCGGVGINRFLWLFNSFTLTDLRAKSPTFYTALGMTTSQLTYVCKRLKPPSWVVLYVFTCGLYL